MQVFGVQIFGVSVFGVCRSLVAVSSVAVPPDDHGAVMVVVPAAMPTAVMAHLGARTPAMILVMMAAALDHDGLGACHRWNGHGQCSDRSNNKTNLFHRILLNEAGEEPCKGRNVPPGTRRFF